jgi:hypothetical protein
MLANDTDTGQNGLSTLAATNGTLVELTHTHKQKIKTQAREESAKITNYRGQ